MSALSPEVRTKLARVLGLLGSNHPGERDAAGLAADRIVRGAGLSWEDLLQPNPSTGPWQASDLRGDREDDLDLCLRNMQRLSAWEQDFVLSLSRRCRRSSGQLAKLHEVAQALREKGRS